METKSQLKNNIIWTTKTVGFLLLLLSYQISLAQVDFKEKQYTISQTDGIVAIGTSKPFYVDLTSEIPSNALITKVEAKFNYTAYGVVQNFVSCRFNKGADPGTTLGVLFLTQGALPSGQPGTYGYNSNTTFQNWNDQSANDKYYFRFFLASGSPYTVTIQSVTVKISYKINIVLPDLVAVKAYMASLGNPGTELTNPKVGDIVRFNFEFRLDKAAISSPFKVKCYLDNNNNPFYSGTFENAISGQTYYPQTVGDNCTWIVQAGYHEVRWVIDSDGAVSESDETNNIVIKSWNIAQQFDLRATAASIVDASGNDLKGLIGQFVYPKLNYTVIGQGTTPSFDVRCLKDNSTVIYSLNGIIKNGGIDYSIISTSGFTVTSGEHNIKWTLDFNNNVAESDETNNIATMGWTAQNVPTVPQKVQVIYQKTQNWNLISFDKANDAIGYRIYWNTNPGVTKQNSNPFIETSDLFTGHSGVQMGNCYYYRVAAYNSSAESNLSSEVHSCLTNVPIIDLISPAINQSYSNKFINFQWTSISNESRYELYVDNNSGLGSPEVSPLQFNDMKDLKQTNFTIPENWLTPGYTYYWKVIAKTPTGDIESIIGKFVYEPIPNKLPQWAPFYRVFNPKVIDHFYCSSDTHLDQAVNANYRFEGVEGYVALNPFEISSPNQLMPIYRFYQTNSSIPKMSCHYYTSNGSDRDNRISQGWIYEGISGYGLSLPEEGLTSLYHTYLNIANNRRDNFYTVSEIQKNNSISLFGYSDEGSICYISATGDNSTMPWLSNSIEVGSGVNPQNGNLSHYLTNIFAIPEGKVGLNYGHLYNSLAVRYFRNNNPLGNGWSHAYNISLSLNDVNIFVIWPDEVNLYNKSSLKSITPGVYDILTQVSASQYKIRKKDQSVYLFEKQSNVANAENTFWLTSITDRHGNQIQLNYNNQGWLKWVKSPANRFISFTYYQENDTARYGLIHYVKDSLALNRRVEYNYDEQRNLIKFIDAKNQSTNYTYNTKNPFDHFLESVTFADGTIIKNSYDPDSKRLMGQSFISNQPTKLTTISIPTARQVSVTDETNRTITLKYDIIGNITDLITPQGKATYQFLDSLINPTKPTEMIDGKGFKTTVAYNKMGDPITINKPLDITHQYRWNEANDLVKYINPRNIETIFTYIGEDLSAIKTSRGTTNITYFSSGNIEKINDPLSQTITFAYDTYNNTKSISDILSNSTKYDYDDASRIVKVTDANNKSTTYKYDENDLLKSMDDALTKTTKYDYDGSNRLISVQDARGNMTSMTFDNNNGLLKQVTDQLKHNTSYDYYDNGLLKSVLNRNNQSINYAYDDNNRLTSTAGPSINRIFIYDLNNNLEELKDNNGSLKFSYDELNRLKSQTDFYGNLVKYEYDEANNLKTMSYGEIGKTVEYEYDPDNLLKTVKDWQNRITTYTYRNDGTINRIDLPNKTFTKYSYDAAGRLTGLANKKLDGTAINSYSYTLDGVGNQIGVTSNEPLSSPVLAVSNVTNTYDQANRIINAGDAIFGHDLNGNLTQQKKNGIETVFNYNAENKLSGINGKFNASYLYDGFGFRRSATRSGLTTHYVLDIANSMENVIIDTDASNQPLFYYIYGNGLLYRIKESGNSVQYYHYDSRGSTIAISDQNQNITHKYAYDAFGKVTNLVESESNLYRYVGKYGVMYEDSSLYFMRARYYIPDIGRFSSEDPVWNVNLYVYSGNNPIVRIDKDGRFYQILAGGVIGGVVGGTMSYIEQKSTGNQVDWNRVWFESGKGAINGMITSVNPFAGALTSGSMTFLTDILDGKSINTALKDGVIDCGFSIPISKGVQFARPITNRLAHVFAKDLRTRYGKYVVKGTISSFSEEMVKSVLKKTIIQ